MAAVVGVSVGVWICHTLPADRLLLLARKTGPCGDLESPQRRRQCLSRCRLLGDDITALHLTVCTHANFVDLFSFFHFHCVCFFLMTYQVYDFPMEREGRTFGNGDISDRCPDMVDRSAKLLVCVECVLGKSISSGVTERRYGSFGIMEESGRGCLPYNAAQPPVRLLIRYRPQLSSENTRGDGQ